MRYLGLLFVLLFVSFQQPDPKNKVENKLGDQAVKDGVKETKKVTNKTDLAGYVELKTDTYLYIMNNKIIHKELRKYILPDKTIIYASRNTVISLNKPFKFTFFNDMAITFPPKLRITPKAFSKNSTILYMSTYEDASKFLKFRIADKTFPAELKPGQLLSVKINRDLKTQLLSAEIIPLKQRFAPIKELEIEFSKPDIKVPTSNKFVIFLKASTLQIIALASPFEPTS